MVAAKEMTSSTSMGLVISAAPTPPPSREDGTLQDEDVELGWAGRGEGMEGMVMMVAVG